MADNKSSDTVTVALKYPHGLQLRLFNMVEVQEAQQGGGTRTVMRAQPRGDARVQLKGYLEKYDVALPPAARSSSFALTHGVSRAFMEEWLKQNADHDLVKNGLLFIQGSSESARAQAREHAEIKCGLEPVDPSKLTGPKLSSYSQGDQA